MKILIIEIWGLGDAVLATGAIRNLQEAGHEVSIVCKPQTMDLLETKLGNVKNWHTYNFPWTAHKGKYRIWRWNWKSIIKLMLGIRKQEYDISLSIRADPRDDMLAFLGRVKKRVGYKRWKMWPVLNDGFWGIPKGHRVEIWERLSSYVNQAVTDDTPLLVNDNKPTKSIVIHVGASVAVRRWPLDKVEQLIMKLKSDFNDYEIILICDPDGFGLSLKDKVETCYHNITLEKMIEIMSAANLVIGNDSGPTHIAAALNVNTCTIFGPQFSETFRPWSQKSDVVEGRDCQFKACKDYCRFEVPHCIHDVPVSEVWEKVRNKLIK